MIYKIIAVLTLILVALPANAKQMKFIGVQDCGPVKQITQNTVVNWGEKPLIRAQGVQFGPEGTKYESAMMYFVNQRHWHLEFNSIIPRQYCVCNRSWNKVYSLLRIRGYLRGSSTITECRCTTCKLSATQRNRVERSDYIPMA